MAGAGQSRLTTFIGFYWLLGSVLTIRWVGRSQEAPGRRLGALAAVIGAVTALALLARRPVDEVVATGLLLDLVGAGSIATGAMRMLGGFRDDQLADERPRKRDSTLVAALDVRLDVDVGACPRGCVGARRRNVAPGHALRVRRSAGTSAEAKSAS